MGAMGVWEGLRMFRFAVDAILLGVVYAGVAHYTHHNCIALSAVAALVYTNWGVIG